MPRRLDEKISCRPQSPMRTKGFVRRYKIAKEGVTRMANSEAPEPATLAELGVSRERVRQLQREAEGVLRDAAGEHCLGFPTAA